MQQQLWGQFLRHIINNAQEEFSLYSISYLRILYPSKIVIVTEISLN